MLVVGLALGVVPVAVPAAEAAPSMPFISSWAEDAHIAVFIRTDRDAICRADYDRDTSFSGPGSGTRWGPFTWATEHRIRIYGIHPDTVYYVRAGCYDRAGDVRFTGHWGVRTKAMRVEVTVEALHLYNDSDSTGMGDDMWFRFSAWDAIAHDYRRHKWPSRSAGVDLSDGCPSSGGCLRSWPGRFIPTSLPWTTVIPLDRSRHETHAVAYGWEDDSTFYCPGCDEDAAASVHAVVPLDRDAWSMSAMIQANDEDLVFNVPVRFRLLWV